MIEVRAFYGEWKEATHEQAVRFIKLMIIGFSAIKNEEKLKRINEKHLRGVTAEELLCVE